MNDWERWKNKGIEKKENKKVITQVVCIYGYTARGKVDAVFASPCNDNYLS